MLGMPVRLRQPAVAGVQPSIPLMTTPENLDHMLHNWQSRFTGGRSPSTVALAFMDWAAHTANSPFKTAALGQTAMTQWQRLVRTMMGGENSIAPQPGDHRFVPVSYTHLDVYKRQAHLRAARWRHTNA